VYISKLSLSPGRWDPLCSCAGNEKKKQQRNLCILEPRGDQLRDQFFCLNFTYAALITRPFMEGDRDKKKSNITKTTNWVWKRVG
jgi:hypothetical protein